MKKIVKFEKEDCQPCVMVSEYFSTRNIAFEAINPFNQPEIAMKFRIRSVPTTLLLEEDQEVMRVVGYQPQELSTLVESL